jgi:hypothetical protein
MWLILLYNFFRNMFRYDKFLASYALDVHRNAYGPLCELPVIVF